MVNKIKCEFCKKEILPKSLKRHQNTKRCRLIKSNKNMIDKIDVKIKCEFCKKEILPINLKRHQNGKRCREHCFEKCGKRAHFHFEGNSSETHRLYCGDHGKKLGMVDVTHPTCKHEKCETRSNFNYEGETKGLYCSKHGRELGMVDVTNPTCKHEKCDTQPTFNYEGETKGLYCSDHKFDNMVDVKHQTCKLGC